MPPIVSEGFAKPHDFVIPDLIRNLQTCLKPLNKDSEMNSEWLQWFCKALFQLNINNLDNSCVDIGLCDPIDDEYFY